MRRFSAEGQDPYTASVERNSCITSGERSPSLYPSSSCSCAGAVMRTRREASRHPSPAPCATAPAPCVPGVTVEAVQPGPDRKEPLGDHRRHRTIPNRRPDAGHLHAHLRASGVQHRQARGHRPRRVIDRNHRRRDARRLARRDRDGQGREPDRRRAERQAAARDRQRDRQRHSGLAQLSQPGRVGAGPQRGRRSERWRDQRTRSAERGRPRRRDRGRPLQRRWPGRERLERRRDVVCDRHGECVGSDHRRHRRPGRGRGRRSGDQRGTQDGRQLVQRLRVRRWRQRLAAGQQLRRRAGGGGIARTGQAEEAVGDQRRHRRTDQEGQVLVLPDRALSRDRALRGGHVRQQERRQPEFLHLRSGLQPAGDQRRRLDRHDVADHVAVVLASEDQPVLGRTGHVPQLLGRRERDHLARGAGRIAEHQLDPCVSGVVHGAVDQQDPRRSRLWRRQPQLRQPARRVRPLHRPHGRTGGSDSKPGVSIHVLGPGALVHATVPRVALVRHRPAEPEGRLRDL